MDLLKKTIKFIEQAKVYLAIKLLWSNQERKVRVLSTFHSTEADSAWQLLHVMPKLTDQKARYEVFQHALEEMVHAELFRKEAAVHSKNLLTIPKDERQPLYDNNAPIWKFFAYCIVGEKSALDRFSHVAKSLSDSDLRDAFKRVLKDEAGHVHNAKMLAAEFAVDAMSIEKEVSLVKRRRFKEAWMRQGIILTDILANVFLSCLYFIVAPFGFLAARKKINTPILNLGSKSNYITPKTLEEQPT